MARNDFQGRLDLLVLKTLAQRGELHGYGIVLHIQRASDELLRVEEGALYPALHRMEQSGWIRAEWVLTETNRKAKYYRLTTAGLDAAIRGLDEALPFELVTWNQDLDVALFASRSATVALGVLGLLGAMLGMLLVGMAAMWAPAQRALRVNPSKLMREE